MLQFDDCYIGQRVRSRAVGSKPAFVGTIVERMHGAFHVKDDEDGSLWHREPRELSEA